MTNGELCIVFACVALKLKWRTSGLMHLRKNLWKFHVVLCYSILLCY